MAASYEETFTVVLFSAFLRFFNFFPRLAVDGNSSINNLDPPVKFRHSYAFPLILRSLATLVLIVAAFSAEAVTYYSRATGNWNNNNTWSLSSGGAAVGPGIFPVAGDIVFIEGGFTVTVNVPSACTSINIAAAPSQLTISFGQSLTVSADFSGTGNLNGGVTARVINVGGDYTFNGTATGSFALTLNGTGNQILSGVINGAAATNGQLNINKVSGTVTMASAITVFGSTSSTFTLTNGTFDPATFLLTVTSPTFTAGTLRVGAPNWGSNYSFASVAVPLAGTVEYYRAGAQTINNVNIGGNLTLSGSGTKTLQAGTTSIAGNFTISGTASTAAVTGLTIGGDVILNSGATWDGASFTHNVAGDWTDNGGTFTPSTSTINFNAAVAQQINGTDAIQTFNNIVINKSGGALTVGGSTTTINAVDLTLTAGSFTGPATLTLSDDIILTAGTFTAGTNTNVAGDFTNNGATFTPGAGTVTFNGAGAQQINGTSATQTFNNLVVNKAGGALSVGGSTTTLSVANLTQTLGDFAGPATLNVSNALLLSAGTFTAGTTTNLSGNLTNNGATMVPGTGTTNFIGGVQTIGGSSPVSLHHVTTSGTAAASTAVTTSLSGNLTVGNGTSFSVGAFNFSNAGTTTIGSGGAAVLNITGAAGSKTFTGLVTVSTGANWNNSGNSHVTFRGGITNNGTFTAGAGTNTFDTNTQSLTGTLSIPTVNVSGITLINNNSLTVGTALNGTGDLTQASGSTLQLSGSVGISTLNAINAGNTVTYGGASQTIFPTTYNNLTVIQSSGDAVLSGATRVNGALSLSAGNVNLGTNILTLGPTATAPAPIGIVLASGGGEMRKEYSATGSFTFPIGDSAPNPSPLQVNVTAGTFSSAYVSARVVAAKHPNNASATNYLNRYWVISQSGISGAFADVTGTFVGGEVTGAVAATAGAYLSGNFDQVSNPWKKDVALSGTTMSLSAVPLASGVNTVCTGIRLAPPTVSITGGGVTVCAGTPVSLGTTVSGDVPIVYSWSPLTGLSSSTIANPVATPLVTTLYTVTIRDGNGITATDNTTITVNPTPDVLATPSSQVICSGQNTGIVLSNPNLTPGTLYTWTVVQSGVTGATAQAVPVAGPIVQALTASGAVPGTATYSVTPVAGTCSGTPLIVVVTVNPVPSVLDPTDQSVCAGANTAAVNFSGVATAYTWTNDTPSIGLAASGSGNIAAFAATNAGITPVVATITVTPEYTFGALTCTGTSQSFTITVNPTPSVADPSDQVV
ncbi:MAG: hypothetical protein JNN04_08410, partial [Cyclobacteriaceae bacterium]|nr:hypothetical protein [Cyclobacteriaceae bacterium]